MHTKGEIDPPSERSACKELFTESKWNSLQDPQRSPTHIIHWATADGRGTGLSEGLVTRARKYTHYFLTGFNEVSDLNPRRYASTDWTSHYLHILIFVCISDDGAVCSFEKWSISDLDIHRRQTETSLYVSAGGCLELNGWSKSMSCRVEHHLRVHEKTTRQRPIYVKLENLTEVCSPSLRSWYAMDRLDQWFDEVTKAEGVFYCDWSLADWIKLLGIVVACPLFAEANMHGP